jgi:hypothetical protein
MTTKRITDLVELTTEDDGTDVLAIEDISTGTTKKIKLSTLLTWIAAQNNNWQAQQDFQDVVAVDTISPENAAGVTIQGSWTDFLGPVKADTIETHTASGNLTVKVGNASNEILFETGAGSEFARLKYTSGLSLGVAVDLNNAGVLLPYAGGGIYWTNGGGTATAGITATTGDMSFWALKSTAKTQFQLGSGGFYVVDLSINTLLSVDTTSVVANVPVKLPSYTTTQRDALASPAAGWTIFNSTTGKLNFYDGSAWRAVTST